MVYAITFMVLVLIGYGYNATRDKRGFIGMVIISSIPCGVLILKDYLIRLKIYDLELIVVIMAFIVVMIAFGLEELRNSK